MSPGPKRTSSMTTMGTWKARPKARYSDRMASTYEAMSGVAATPDIASYVEAILSLYLAFGLAFQVPIVVMLLVRFGPGDIAKLKSFRGYFILGAFIIAAVVTPPDVISQLALAVPMCILYEIGILGAGWFSRVSKAPEEEAEPGTAVDKPAEDKPSP